MSMTAESADQATGASDALTPADVRRVIVVGAGQMGAGIAQVFAQAGREVWLSDLAPDMLDKARAGIEKSSGKLHAKGQLDDAQLEGVRERITYVQGLADLDGADVQLAIEAIVEEASAKHAVLGELDRLLPATAVLASNTSSISITRLAAATGRPTRVVGMHFMNPVPMLPLVEVIPGMQTDPAVTRLVVELARDLGKTPVESGDAPGFITNRVLMPLINEAFFCLHEGVGTAEAIDDAMRLGMRHPLGPLALADLIGLDTTLSILEVLQRDLGDPKYRPCPLLRRYVDAGRLGRKSGAGVFEYEPRA